MVVAPFNVQTNNIKQKLLKKYSEKTRVGTIDLFQGQQAKVVFISMTSSDSDNLPRHKDFFFNRNRLNVAISRAQNVAVILFNPNLLLASANTIHEMRLMNNFCKLLLFKIKNQKIMDRYDKNSFYFSITENLWCWKQTSTGKIFKAETKTELSKIKEKQFIGSGNYEREYNLDKGQVSTEEFGKMTNLGTKQYISLLLKRGTTPISSYDKNTGGDGVHRPEGRRKKDFTLLSV